MKIHLCAIVSACLVLAGCSHTSIPSNTPGTVSGTQTLPYADENTIHNCLMGGAQGCDIIMDPANKATYGTLVQKVCNEMPMKGCAEYLGQDMSGDNTGHTMDHANMVQSEFDFIYLMIPHHQEAVDSSQIIASVGQNPQLKQLAQDIIDAQNTEIAMMSGWLQNYYSGVVFSGMHYMPMMRDTSTISAITTIENIWTEDIITHHQGAVDMAQKVIQLIEEGKTLIPLTDEFKADLLKFAHDVIDVQSQEIQTMQGILAN